MAIVFGTVDDKGTLLKHQASGPPEQKQGKQKGGKKLSPPLHLTQALKRI